MGPIDFGQISQLAMNMLSRNPQFQNNPQAKYMMQIIQSGDSVQGQEIAENLCKTYGVTPEQAVQQAKQFFKLPF